MSVTIIRTLRQRFHIHAPDQASGRVLDYMAADPDIPGAETENRDFHVENHHGFLRLADPDEGCAEGSAENILSFLHKIHFAQCLREFPDAFLIHGGTITREKGHIVVVGSKGSGKSTLLLRLAAAGCPVMGDEHIVVDGPVALPRPRSMRIKESTLNYLSPDLADKVRASPSMSDWFGVPIYAVSPAAFGGPWSIEAKPITDIVFLDPNHGGRSVIKPMDPDSATEQLLKETILPRESRMKALIALRQLVQTAKTWQLTNGQLEGSERIMYSIM